MTTMVRKLLLLPPVHTRVQEAPLRVILRVNARREFLCESWQPRLLIRRNVWNQGGCHIKVIAVISPVKEKWTPAETSA